MNRWSVPILKCVWGYETRRPNILDRVTMKHEMFTLNCVLYCALGSRALGEWHDGAASGARVFGSRVRSRGLSVAPRPRRGAAPRPASSAPPCVT